MTSKRLETGDHAEKALTLVHREGPDILPANTSVREHSSPSAEAAQMVPNTNALKPSVYPRHYPGVA
jgi:hypothetical protein